MPGWLASVREDFRLAVRGLLRAPGFTTVTLLSLALGVGATTTIYSVVHAVVIDPFPYKDPWTLVSLNMMDPRGRGNWSSYTVDELVELEERATVLEAVIASTISDVAMTGAGDPERVRGNFVTMNTFDVMGVPPLLGRTTTPADTRPDAPPVAVLGYRFWQTRFGGSPDVIGRQLRLNGTLREVIGVMPRRFMWRGADVYLPTVFKRGDVLPGVRTLHVMGRLRHGATPAQVEAGVRPILEDLQRQSGDRLPPAFRLSLVPFPETFASGLREPLLVLLGAVGLLLLIACVNVSNLLLARGATREREVAMRAALGAGRGRLVRLLFAESAVLAVAGALLGVALARASIAIVMRIVPPNTIPDESHVALNAPVLLFAVGAAVASCLFFGLYPAWQAARADMMTLLREGGRGAGAGRAAVRVRSGLIVAEVALAVVLLVGASLMMRTLTALQHVDIGFQPEQVLTMRVPLAETRYPTREQRRQFFDSLLERVGAVPGVTRAAVSSSLPLYGGRGTAVEVPGEPPNPNLFVRVHEISAGYFDIVASRLAAGRLIEARDVAAAQRIGVINEAFVRRYFPSQPPLGRTVRLSYLAQPPINAPDTSIEIVGIVRDDTAVLPGRSAAPEVFVPFTIGAAFVRLVATTALPPEQLERSIRGQVYALDPEQPVTDVQTFAGLLDEWTFSRPRFSVILLGLFSAIGLTLSVIGVYGLTAYAVSRQIPEIGVRMALGATRHDVLGLVVGRGLRLLAIGIGIGLVGAFAATRALASQLVGVSRLDVVSFAGVALLLLVVGVAACLVPAMRAARVSPMTALRET